MNAGKGGKAKTLKCADHALIEVSLTYTKVAETFTNQPPTKCSLVASIIEICDRD